MEEINKKLPGWAAIFVHASGVCRLLSPFGESLSKPDVGHANHSAKLRARCAIRQSYPS